MQWQILQYEMLDSTNLEAKRMIQEKKKENIQQENTLHGMVLTAEQQTGGKGRLGRPWESPKGTGLWVSAIIKPNLPMEQTSLYSFAVAVSVAEAICQETGLVVQLKWPNDVLLNNKKICGILLELMPYTKTEYYVIAGIGINVNQQKLDFPPELQEKASSIAMVLGHEVNRAALLSAVLQKLQENCALLEVQGFAPLRDKWKALSCVLGQEVSVQQQGKEIYSGVAEDISMDGALLVRTKDGIVSVTAGDVSLRAKNGGYVF